MLRAFPFDEQPQSQVASRKSQSKRISARANAHPFAVRPGPGRGRGPAVLEIARSPRRDPRRLVPRALAIGGRRRILARVDKDIRLDLVLPFVQPAI